LADDPKRAQELFAAIDSAATGAPGLLPRPVPPSVGRPPAATDAAPAPRR